MKKKIAGQFKTSSKTISKKEKLQVALTLLAITALIVGGLYWIGISAGQDSARRAIALNKGSKYAQGIITSIHYYKGRSIHIRYKVNGTNYEYNGSWDHNPKHLDKDDSISLKYAVSDPSVVITELEDGY
jgi:hypothetical protein